MIFKDRSEAGKMLSQSLSKLDIKDPLVIAIPRGGVIVAEEVANQFSTSIKLIIPRKIGAPQNQEVAIGAVTQDGTAIYDDYLMGILGISEEDLTEDTQRVIEEIKRRSNTYPNILKLEEVPGRDVILLDDGIATGYTVFAALKSLKSHKPRNLILAVPVAPQEILHKISNEVDEIVCLDSPEDFYAVGQFYEHFNQVSDEEVLKVLE